MPKNYVQIQAVSDDGTLRPQAAEPGARYLIVRAPKLPQRAGDALEGPKALLDDVATYVREHRNLSRKQYAEFTERYGDPRDKVKHYAERLGPEEFQRRAQEFNAYVQTRFEDVARDMESRYEKLEHEFDATVERVFGRKADAGESAAEPVEVTRPRVEDEDQADEKKADDKAGADEKANGKKAEKKADKKADDKKAEKNDADKKSGGKKASKKDKEEKASA